MVFMFIARWAPRPRFCATTGAVIALLVLPACGGAPGGDSTPNESAAATYTRQTAVPRAPEGGSVQVRLLEWGIELSRDTVPAGLASFAISNTGTHRHEFAITGPGLRREVYVQPGANIRLRVALQRGTYEIDCSVHQDGIDHAREGMRAVLVVQ